MGRLSATAESMRTAETQRDLASLIAGLMERCSACTLWMRQCTSRFYGVTLTCQE